MDHRIRAVTWAESARAAVDELIGYIANDSPDNARRVLAATLEAATSLQSLSERGRVVPELDDPNVRELFVSGYRLLYRVSDRQVTIVAFVRGARDFATWRADQTFDE